MEVSLRLAGVGLAVAPLASLEACPLRLGRDPSQSRRAAVQADHQQVHANPVIGRFTHGHPRRARSDHVIGVDTTATRTPAAIVDRGHRRGDRHPDHSDRRVRAQASCCGSRKLHAAGRRVVGDRVQRQLRLRARDVPARARRVGRRDRPASSARRTATARSPTSSMPSELPAKHSPGASRAAAPARRPEALRVLLITVAERSGAHEGDQSPQGAARYRS